MKFEMGKQAKQHLSDKKLTHNKVIIIFSFLFLFL